MRRRPPGGITTRVVAVDGPGGAGKTTFAARLSGELGGAQVAQTDDFASWDNPVDWWPRCIAELLAPLADGQIARYAPTAWGGEAREPIEIAPAQVVILEGVTASRESFRPYLAYCIWIETPGEVRLRRGLDRDGAGARAQWERWMAEEDGYVARERPQERADIVVPGGV